MLFAFHCELISSGSLEQTRSCSMLARPRSDQEGMEKCYWPSSVIGGESSGSLGVLQGRGLSIPQCVITSLWHLTPEPTRSLPPKFPFPVLASAATALCLADGFPPPFPDQPSCRRGRLFLQLPRLLSKRWQPEEGITAGIGLLWHPNNLGWAHA